eukprot:Hpha_TRINITY_DN8205_c0_g2::TRINITY_DN8205_c0_g2_i1::g.112053::m.112053
MSERNSENGNGDPRRSSRQLPVKMPSPREALVEERPFQDSDSGGVLEGLEPTCNDEGIIYCVKCGNLMWEDSAFCRQCGTRQRAPPVRDTSEPPKGRFVHHRTTLRGTQSARSPDHVEGVGAFGSGLRSCPSQSRLPPVPVVRRGSAISEADIVQRGSPFVGSLGSIAALHDAHVAPVVRSSSITHPGRSSSVTHPGLLTSVRNSSPEVRIIPTGLRRSLEEVSPNALFWCKLLQQKFDAMQEFGSFGHIASFRLAPSRARHRRMSIRGVASIAAQFSSLAASHRGADPGLDRPVSRGALRRASVKPPFPFPLPASANVQGAVDVVSAESEDAAPSPVHMQAEDPFCFSKLPPMDWRADALENILLSQDGYDLTPERLHSVYTRFTTDGDLVVGPAFEYMGIALPPDAASELS